MSGVTPDDARGYLREHHRGVLATRRADGGVQLSPIVAGIDGDGRVIISSRETAMKVKNLRRDPLASLVAFPDAFFGRPGWVQVEGRAEIVSLPDAMEPLIDYYRRLSGEHPNWDEYREAMNAQGRVLIRFAIERAGPNVSG